MKNYYRVYLGAGNIHAAECFTGNYIGAFGIQQNLSGDLSEDWRVFNRKFIPIYLKEHPGKSKIAAGLACGALWTVCKGIQNGDIVLCPDGTGRYHLGEVNGDYFYDPAGALMHRRPVKWMGQFIDKTDMSEPLKYSCQSIGTVSNITKHSTEIEKLMGASAPPPLISTDPTVEDASVFALEKHLEDFLVENWSNTELGQKYDIFEEEGVLGQQFPADNGKIDILAISKDKKELLVVELKKGKASDVVVGQTLRYMGFVLEELAEENQAVKGVIIAFDDDLRIRRALAATNNIEFYRYEVTFKLLKT